MVLIPISRNLTGGITVTARHRRASNESLRTHPADDAVGAQRCDRRGQRLDVVDHR
jgi:hypothetical protein